MPRTMKRVHFEEDIFEGKMLLTDKECFDAIKDTEKGLRMFCQNKYCELIHLCFKSSFTTGKNIEDLLIHIKKGVGVSEIGGQLFFPADMFHNETKKVKIDGTSVNPYILLKAIKYQAKTKDIWTTPYLTILAHILDIHEAADEARRKAEEALEKATAVNKSSDVDRKAYSDIINLLEVAKETDDYKHELIDEKIKELREQMEPIDELFNESIREIEAARKEKDELEYKKAGRFPKIPHEHLKHIVVLNFLSTEDFGMKEQYLKKRFFARMILHKDVDYLPIDMFKSLTLEEQVDAKEKAKHMSERQLEKKQREFEEKAKEYCDSLLSDLKQRETENCDSLLSDLKQRETENCESRVSDLQRIHTQALEQAQKHAEEALEKALSEHTSHLETVGTNMQAAENERDAEKRLKEAAISELTALQGQMKLLQEENERIRGEANSTRGEVERATTRIQELEGAMEELEAAKVALEAAQQDRMVDAEAEAAKLEAEAAKLEAEGRATKAEAAKLAAEGRATEAEGRVTDAEAAKLEAEAAKLKAEERATEAEVASKEALREKEQMAEAKTKAEEAAQEALDKALAERDEARKALETERVVALDMLNDQANRNTSMNRIISLLSSFSPKKPPVKTQLAAPRTPSTKSMKFLSSDLPFDTPPAQRSHRAGDNTPPSKDGPGRKIG